MCKIVTDWEGNEMKISIEAKKLVFTEDVSNVEKQFREDSRRY